MKSPVPPARNLQRDFVVAAARLLTRNDIPGVWRVQRPARRLARFLSSRCIPKPHGPVLCTTNYGFQLVVHPAVDTGVEDRIYRTGTYEPGTLAIFRRLLRPGDTFIDAGANIGLMTVYGAKLVGPRGTVHAFEPLESIFEQLSVNVAINRLGNVHLHKLALGSRSDTRPIYEHPEINRGSSSMVDVGASQPAGLAEIVTLDDFLRQHKLSTARLIKIDVEGWELEVLRGARRFLAQPSAPAICIECSRGHPMEGGDTADMFDWIMSVNDYRCFRLRGGKEVPSPLDELRSAADLPEHDNLFFLLPEHVASLAEAREGDRVRVEVRGDLEEAPRP